MLRLTRRKRPAVGCAGAVLVSAGIALAPVSGRPAARMPPLPGIVRHAVSASPVAGARPALGYVDDPFARPLPGSTSPPASGRIAVHRQRGHPFVRAIVAGARPRALIDDGAIRIVGIGEIVDTSRIVAIGPNAVVLADGRRLGFETPPP
jgi:hypothetical protein